MIKIFCSKCGNKISVMDEKPFCFCTNCGYRIEMIPTKQKTPIENTDKRDGQQERIERPERIKDVYLEEKLKEVEFYYQLSFKKKEYLYTEKDPVYYLKAQDLLEELKDKYSSDYRVWWEQSKPLDFMCEEFTKECVNLPPLNEAQFQKSLDVAKIEQKIDIIEKHDKYIERKKAYIEQYNHEKKQRELEELHRKKAEEEEREKKRAAEEEERKRREKVEEEKKIRDAKQKEEAEKKAREQAEKERIETEKQRQEAERQKAVEQKKLAKRLVPFNDSLWSDLSIKKYDQIDGGYFIYTESTGDEITIAFRNISNILYLTGYKKLEKNKITYSMQTLAVKTDDKGNIVGFNNAPIVIIDKRMNVNIQYLGENQLAVNGIPLIVDKKYVDSLARTAKKALIKKKIFK